MKALEECCGVKKTASLSNYYLPYFVKHAGIIEGNQKFGTANDEENGLAVKISFKTEDNQIVKARHSCNSEPVLIAGCERLCEMLEGKTLDYAKKVTADELIDFFPEVPVEKRSLLELTVKAMRRGLE
ncbi:MAG: iron-sulfur cluster assembly scaffold protein [Candidatus Bathyarchaeia archaeon]